MSKTKKQIEQQFREYLYDSALFGPIRSIYQNVFDRKKLDTRKQMRSLYGAFIRPGDLVFDIGAYIGNYAELFVDLGARVVAAEPNPNSFEKLQKKARSRKIQLERCAVGEKPGKLSLHICRENPTISTVANQWYEAAKKSPLHHNNTWIEPVEVEVMTLDQLQSRYGTPSFVKIDAEGFDDQVLRGASFKPSALTFEFNKEIMDVALRCLDAPIFADRDYQFNYTKAMEMELATNNWMTTQQMYAHLQNFASDEFYGDVFARRTSSARN